MDSLKASRPVAVSRPMGQIWGLIRSFAARVRTIQTPMGGLSWDPPTPRADDSVEANVAGEAQASGAVLFEPEAVHDQILSEIAESRERALSVRQVSNRLGLSTLRAEHYVDELETEGFLESDGSRYYGLSAIGRAYVVETDLID